MRFNSTAKPETLCTVLVSFLIWGYKVVFYGVSNFLSSFLTFFSSVVAGARVSERDSREIVKLPSFEETEGMTESYGRENPPCTLGNQGNCINILRIEWKTIFTIWTEICETLCKIKYWKYTFLWLVFL